MSTSVFILGLDWFFNFMIKDGKVTCRFKPFLGDDLLIVWARYLG